MKILGSDGGALGPPPEREQYNLRQFLIALLVHPDERYPAADRFEALMLYLDSYALGENRPWAVMVLMRCGVNEETLVQLGANFISGKLTKDRVSEEWSKIVQRPR